jgi:hypothetical protein
VKKTDRPQSAADFVLVKANSDARLARQAQLVERMAEAFHLTRLLEDMISLNHNTV